MVNFSFWFHIPLYGSLFASSLSKSRGRATTLQEKIFLRRRKGKNCFRCNHWFIKPRVRDKALCIRDKKLCKTKLFHDWTRLTNIFIQGGPKKGEPLHNFLCRFRSYFECIKLNLITSNVALNRAQLRFGFDHLNITFIIFKANKK